MSRGIRSSDGQRWYSVLPYWKDPARFEVNEWHPCRHSDGNCTVAVFDTEVDAKAWAEHLATRHSPRCC